MWINAKTLKTYRLHSDIRYDCAASLPEHLTNEVLEDAGFYPVIPVSPELDPETQEAVEVTPEEIGGKWFQRWDVIPIPPEHIAARNKSRAEILLAETEWATAPCVSDAEHSDPYLANQKAFRAYRSAVRKVAVYPPNTPVVFPEKPAPDWRSVDA